jgi:pilus assembly protein CpaE
MHIAFASSRPWGFAEAYQDSNRHRISIVVSQESELPGRLAAILPDIVVLNFEGDEIAEAVARINKASIRTIIIPFGAAASPDLLVKLMRLGVDDVLMEEDTNSLERILSNIEGSSKPADVDERLKRAKRISFLAAKGGNGTTFLLSNFATALAEQTGSKVLLIDLSIPFGDIDMYLSPTKPEHDLVDFILQAERLDQALLDAMVHHVSERLALIPSPSTMERVLKIKSGDVMKLIKKIEKFYEYILFDLGTSIDQVGLPIIETIDQLVVTSRPDLPNARRTGQVIQLLSDLEFPMEKLVIISNEFGARTAINPQEFEQAIGHTIQHRIPDAGPTVPVALVQSKAAITLAPKSQFAKVVNNWVTELSGRQHKGRRLWAIFGSN